MISAIIVAAVSVPHLLQDVHCSTVGGQHLQHPSDLGLLGLTSLDLLGAASEQQGHRR